VVTGKFAFEIVPVRFEALRFERPNAFPAYAKLVIDTAFKVVVTFAVIRFAPYIFPDMYKSVVKELQLYRFDAERP
jgi:hypothetical protein